MNAVAAWARLDLRRRARSLAVLAVLVAVVTGTVLTAVAGARRGGTAVDRLLERTRPATLAVLPNEPGFDWDAVAAIPGVDAVARFPVSPYEIEGVPSEDAADFAYMDAALMHEIERPVVLEGRLADPSADDEAVVTAGFERSYGLGVGDTVVLRLYTPEQMDDQFSLGAGTGPGGPRIETRIVGVVRSPWFSDTTDAGSGRVIPSTALFARHPDNLLGTTGQVSVNALVRLDGGAAAVPAFRERLAEVSGRRDIEFFDLPAMADHAADVADFEANSLLAFALAAAVAAVFLVGQSVARYVAGATNDLHVLRGFGMAPRHVRAAAVVGPLLAATVGAVLGAAASYVASGRFPVGSVAPLEPSPGRQLDGAVLAAGVVGVPLLVAAGAVAVAWRTRVVDDQRRGSWVAAQAARWGAPVPVSVGTRFALEPGRGSQAVPVRPALVGAVVGVLGIVAALTFADGVADASAHPARFGQVFQVQGFLGFNGEDFFPVDGALEVIAADPDVVAVNDTRQSVAEAGSVDLPVFSFDPVDEPLAVVVTDGRLPDATNEVTLGPDTAADLDVGAGDEVDLTGTDGSGTYTVSGIAFVPVGSHNDYDAGAWALTGTYDELFAGHKFHTVDISLRPGADPDAVIARLGSSLGAAGFPGDILEVRDPPSRLAELRQVQRLPLLLAAFLGLLAVGAVGHALATAVRRRRHDIAVLRAIGVTRRQSRLIVVTQASLLALVGLVVGVPFGLAVGRGLWRAVAHDTPVAYVPPLAVGLLVLVGPAAFVVANLLAAWPSHRAATARVGQVLRAE